MKPRILRFVDRTIQGPWYHLTTVEWARNRLPGYHTHDYAEIFWLTNGVCEHRLNGTSRRLEAGRVMLLRSADAHGLRPLAGQGAFRFTNLSLSPRCLERLQIQYPQEYRDLYENDSPKDCLLAGPELEELQSEMRQLAAAPHELLFLERAVLNIWSRFLTVRQHPDSQAAMPAWLYDALVRVQEPEIFSCGVSGLVQAAGRCHEHVSRACRQHLGKTPTEIVNDARMQRAAHSLRMTSRPVLEIALDCGFDNPAHFHRLFRRHFGTTPGCYRKG